MTLISRPQKLYTFNEVPYYPDTEQPWLKQDGLVRGWHSNGQLEYETPYINGQRHGLAKGWHSNGQPEYKELYVYGEQRDTNMPRLEQVVHYGKVLI